MALGVLFGAFGAHGLKNIVSPERIDIFETATRYQIYHALALLLTGMLLYFRKTSLMPIAGYLFIAGVACFSGSLYLLTFSDIIDLPKGIIGPFTPIGGLLLVAAWVVLALSTFQDNQKRYRKGSSS